MKKKIKIGMSCKIKSKSWELSPTAYFFEDVFRIYLQEPYVVVLDKKAMFTITKGTDSENNKVNTKIWYKSYLVLGRNSLTKEMVKGWILSSLIEPVT